MPTLITSDTLRYLVLFIHDTSFAAYTQ